MSHPLPVIPAHRQDDYAAFKDLALPAGAHLYLGLINIADGVEGAKRRIAMAEKVVPSFGVGSFCGLGRPPAPDATIGSRDGCLVYNSAGVGWPEIHKF